MNKRKVTILNTQPIKDRVIDIETKKIIHYISSSINFRSGYRCWWCTLLINNEPIGCPINLSYPEKVKTYSTDGVFCSFNCIKAYINDKERVDALYKASHVLLGHMICDIKGIITPVIVDPAPDKKMLAEYGGYMTEQQYKDSFDRIVHTEKGIIKMFPITTIYHEEERLKRCSEP